MKMKVSFSALLAALVLFSGLLIPAPAKAFIPPTTAPVLIPATGQTASYTDLTPPIYRGDDGDLQKGAAWPDPRFSALGDGTVQDHLTGLIWAEDAGTSFASCGGAGAMNWEQALDYVACLNTNFYLGHSDWILPNINELRSLLALGEDYPAISASHPFIDVQSNYYWSSTTSASDINNAWLVDLSDGYLTGSNTKTISMYVWPLRKLTGSGEISLARTGQTVSQDSLYASDDGGLKRGASVPPPRYVDNSDGTVTDTQTFLIWGQESSSAGPAACPNSGLNQSWGDALDFISCLNSNRYLGQNDWRLPNANELTSLLDFSQAYPTLSSGHPFNILASSYFWTSTTYAPDPSQAWSLNIDSGEMTPGYKNDSSNYSVWPVRDANWTLAVDSSGNGSVSVDSGSLSWSGATGTASYPLNTFVSLTPAADPGNTFMGWGDACSGSAACTVTMDRAQHVIATFVQNATDVSLTPGLSSPQSTKTIIPLTAAATGGDSGAYEYRFWWRSTLPGSNWHLGQDYSASAAWSWDPATLKLGGGTYNLQVDTRHVGNPVNREAARNLKYTLLVAPVPATGVTLTTNGATTQPAGATITFTAKASGGDAGPYEYRFWWRSYAPGSSWNIGQNYSTETKWNWNSSALGLSIGSYAILVDVRHVGSSAKFEVKQSLNIVLTPGVTLVSNLSSPQNAGTTVTFSATAKGLDAGPYEYRFWWRATSAGGNWTVGQAYSASNSWDWKTADLGLSAGSYSIQVDARHQGSTARSEMARKTVYVLR